MLSIDIEKASIESPLDFEQVGSSLLEFLLILCYDYNGGEERIWEEGPAFIQFLLELACLDYRRFPKLVRTSIILLLYLSTRKESPDNKQRINIIKQKYSLYLLEKILFQSENDDRLIDLIIRGEGRRRFSIMLRAGKDIEKDVEQLRANNNALLNALSALELENQQLLLGAEGEGQEHIEETIPYPPKQPDTFKQDYSVVEIPSIEISQNNVDVQQSQEEIANSTHPPSMIPPSFDSKIVDV